MAFSPRASFRGPLLFCCLGWVAGLGAPLRGAHAAAAGEAGATSTSAPELAVPAPKLAAAAPRGGALRLRWAQVRANAWLVQNTQGNAYALQLGYTPQLRLRDVPLGLRLLAEFGALRNAGGHVFVAPSAQLLLTWQPVHHVELGLGGGVQIWCVGDGLVQPVATAEAHYVPHRRVAKVIHAVFVAASAGASAGAGLQVRLGLSLDFQRPTPEHEGLPRPTDDPRSALAAAAPLHLQAPNLGAHGVGAACPPCAAAEVASRNPAAAAVREDVLLAVRPHFAFNAAALDAQAEADLRQLGAALAAEPDGYKDVEVVGHADSVGSLASNQQVSEHRAAAVRGVLEEAGVPAGRIVARGVGKTQPIAGERPDAPAQRRAVLRLRDLGDSPRLRAFVQAHHDRAAGENP